MATGGKRVTIKDLAAQCGVSTATISRVLNGIPGRYSSDTEARIRQCAEDMGYVPNQMARSMITQKTNLIAVLVPDIRYHFFQDFFFALERFVTPRGYHLLLCNTQENQAMEMAFVKELTNGLTDGILISTLNSNEQDDYIRELCDSGFPVVLLERYGKKLDNIPHVQVDNYLSAKIAVDYLCNLGHRRIAFIKGAENAKNAEIRYQGYLDGLKAHGIELDLELVSCGNYSFESGVSAMTELLDRAKFTAVVPANGQMTSGACKAIRKRGLRIPEDISVLGLEKSILTATHEPPVTTIDFGAEKLGERVGEYLLDMINGETIAETNYIQPPELFVGRSVQKVF